MDAHESIPGSGGRAGPEPERPLSSLSREQLDAAVLDHLRRIAGLVAAAGRTSYRTAHEIEGLWYTLGGGRTRPRKAGRAEELKGLPAEVAGLPRKVRRVYAALRDARSGTEPAEKIGPKELTALVDRRSPADPISERHVFRALKTLVRANAIRRHEKYGYLIGGQQPDLTF